MKVAVIIDTWFPFVGGGQINAYEISKNLAKKGVIIEIITRNCGKDYLDLPKNLDVIKLGEKTDPDDFFSKITFACKSFIFIYRNNYDLIHAHAFLPGITARLISVFKGTPSVFTIHGTSINTNLNNKLLTLLEKFILTNIKYNAQITVSRDFLNLKNINKKIFYIPNAVNVDQFDKVLSKKQSSPSIIFVGRLHPQKNVISLIISVKLLKMEFPDIKLILVGVGPLKERIISIIKKEKLSDTVSLMGQVSGINLIKLYKSSHVFVLPSLYEGQSLALLEAWAAKIPVIATNTGDNQYLVKNGINGYLISNPTNSLILAKTIKRLLLSKKLNRMGINGYNFVNKNFSWKKSAELTLDVYEDATKRSY